MTALRVRSLAALAVAAALAGCAAIPSQRSSFRNPTDVAHLTRPAAGLSAVKVEGGAADVTFSVAAGDSIRVSVSLRSQNEKRLVETCVPGSRLVSESGSGTLVVRLEQRSRDRCGEVWNVQLPAGLRAEAEVDVGRVAASGLAAGLRARVSATGSVEARVLGGSVDARVQVGDVDVLSETRRTGAVRLRAEVGRVDLSIAGMRIEVPRHGAGATFTSDGPGDQQIRLESGVGNVKLVVAPPAQ